MSKILLAFSIFFSAACFGQAPTIEWQKCLGGTNEDIVRSAKKTVDGGYVIAGNSYSNDGDISGNYGNADTWIVKLNQNGNIQWQQHFGDSEANYVGSIEQTTDGGYIFTGAFFNYAAGLEIAYPDLWVVRMNASGTVLWDKKFGSIFYEDGTDVKQTPDDGFIVVGSVADNFMGEGNDVWLLKLDSAGNLIWEKTFGGLDYDYPENVSLTTDGGCIIGATSMSVDGDITDSHGATDYWIIKLDQFANIQWEKSFGGSGFDSLAQIRQTVDGGYAMIGTTSSSDGDVSQAHGNADFWMVKIDGIGNLQWEKTFGGTLSEMSTSMQQTTEGGYIIGGYSYSTDGDVPSIQGGSDYWVLKLNATGNIEWNKTFGGSNFDQLNDVVQTGDGGFLLAGSVVSNNGDVFGNHGDYDFWVVKLEAPLVTQIFNASELVVFPNPANDFIQVQWPDGKMIDTVKITDMTGKTISQQSGFNGFIAIDTLASGFYLLHTSAGGQTHLAKFLKK